MKVLSCYLGFLSIVFLAFLQGCTSYQLQNAEVYGVPSRNPVKITENREPLSFMASPWFSMNKNKPLSAYIEGHSDVNSKGVYELNPVPGEDYFIEPEDVNRYHYSGNNFLWHIPEAQGGVDLDLALTKHFCVYGGFNFAQMNQRDLLGKRFGVGFFSQSENSAVRFDISMRYQDFMYDVEYLKIENHDGQRRVYVIRDENIDTQSNLDFSLTLHSLHKPVNYFLTLNFGNQNYFSFTPSEAILQELDHSVTYAGFGAGLFMNLSKDIRIIAGARYTIYNEEHGTTSMPDFFIQQDFSLF
ncbi:MAG TPA: hypothetical protein VHO03_11785 [Ignavibacteriales bacterium]|nr:hypothetical protein [Ignavibacteriales bacterium]